MAIGDPQTELQTFANNPGPAPAGGDKNVPPPPVPEEVKLRTDPWSDELAKSIVITDWNRAQGHRTKNYDMRWDDNERLYHANVPQRTWDGTDTPRSSIGVKLIWQQTWSMLPKVRQSLFGNSSDGIFFDAFPLPGTKPEQAIACRELQASQLDSSGFSSYFDIATMEGVGQGAGILKLSWLRTSKEKSVWVDALEPQFANIHGVKIAVGSKRVFRRDKIKQVVNQPKVYHVPLRDFYIDPAHKLPWVNPPDDVPDGTAPRFVIQRGFKSLDDLLGLAKEDKSYSVPSKEDLISRAKKKLGPPKADADTHKQLAAQEQGTFQNFPAQGTSDPAKYPFEILEYWTEDRLVSVLDRELVIRNIPNPYGFIPFFAIIPWPNPNEFYGKGLAEILEGEQRIQQGIINARLDELSLNIHGQLIYQEGMVIGKHQLRPRPGGAIGVTGDVNAAVKRLERQEMTSSAFAEVQQSQMRSEQYTGITGIAVQGAPTEQTSATRTKYGIGVLAGASFSRLEYLIDKISDVVIIPLLNRMYELNVKYLDPSQPIAILGPTLGKEIQINPLYVCNGQFKFEMRAASKLSAKQAMQQSLPFILQTLFNPAVIQNLSEQNQSLNMNAIIRDIFDVMSWRTKGDWIGPMTPQQLQMRQQESQMTSEMLKLQKEQMRLQAKGQSQSQSEQFNMLKMLAEKVIDQAPGAAPLALASALDQANQ